MPLAPATGRLPAAPSGRVCGGSVRSTTLRFPALLAWSAKAPAHVTRELLGRFVQDRDTQAVHDVYQATPECAVDAIRNGTFFHFWYEVLDDTSVADDLPCPHCLAS